MLDSEAAKRPELMGGMWKAVQLTEDLYPILLALGQLHELVDDTYMAVGSEAYAGALLVYNAEKLTTLGRWDSTFPGFSA